MLNKDKKLKKVVNSTVSGATLEMIDELDKNNVSLEEFSGGDFFKLSDEEKVPLRKDINSINESENLEFISNHIGEKQEIPGASLTNDPDKPYPWEQPPKFANPREALDDMYYMLSQPEVAKDVATGLSNGLSVMDLTSLFIFTGFVSGKFTPDVGLLISEPTAYFIMGLGEMANIEYKIEDDDTDLDEFLEEDFSAKLMEANNMERLKQLGNKNNISKDDIPADIQKELEERVEPSLLAPSPNVAEEKEEPNLLDRTE